MVLLSALARICEASLINTLPDEPDGALETIETVVSAEITGSGVPACFCTVRFLLASRSIASLFAVRLLSMSMSLPAYILI